MTMSNKDSKYSVLMSVYRNDKPAYLDDAIASMVNQTLPFNDLVLVCDGPLNDELDSRISIWQDKLDTRLNVVRLNENHGLGYALNAGLPACACDIVARMDSGDLSRPDRCERLISCLIEDNLDLVGGMIEEFDKKPGDMGSIRNVPLTREEIVKWARNRNPFNHVTVMFRRDAVATAGDYQPFPWMEDYWLWVRMLSHGCACANIPDVLVDVRTGDGMYARRSNVAYLKSNAAFFKELRKLGLTSRVGEFCSVLQRVLVTFLPTGLVKVAYNKLLRSKAGDRDGR